MSIIVTERHNEKKKFYARSVSLLWMSPSFFYRLHKMSKENLKVGAFDSFFDLGDEAFTLSKSLEVGHCLQRRFVNYLKNEKSQNINLSLALSPLN